MATLQLSTFDAFTQKYRLDPARALARERGHRFVDIAHLLWIDANSEDSLLRSLIADGATDAASTKKFAEFREGLSRLYLAPEHTNIAPHRAEFSETLSLIGESLRTRIPASDHNLENTVADLLRRNPKGPVRWRDLLAALLDFRPHPVVPHVSTDFGLSGSLLLASSSPEMWNPATEIGTETADASTSLTAYTTDLTAEAERGRFSEAIGRNQEIDRLIAILGQKESNNPILLGDAGVGKTKIVEGLALRMVATHTHPKLRGKRILSLDMGLLVAGSQYRGQFEDRLKALLRALKNADGQIILFIDEIHQLIGLGRTSGLMDAANLMKPALARGELWCIGATTYEEYRHFEADAALRRRFQAVDVQEPSMADVLAIVGKAAPSYAQYHSVDYTQEGLDAIVKMGRRYLGSVHSPAREVALLDEVGSTVSQTMSIADGRNSVRPQVRREHVLSVLSRRTGIPLERMTVDRRARLANLERSLCSRVFGQEEVVQRVARGVRRAMAGLGHPNRPRGVFFFAGPSGVGKTELAKAIADELYDSPESVVRLDMSEFNLETARNRLIGSDPGFVGFEDGGRLTEAMRRRPFSLVILDEFEKAHPNVWRLFLQVIDDGRLTDARGRTATFTEAFIVLTSNVGAALMVQVAELRRRLVAVESDPSHHPSLQISAFERILQDVRRAIPNQMTDDEEFLRSELARCIADPSLKSEAPDYSRLVRHALLSLPGFPPELLSRIGEPLTFRQLSPVDLARILEGFLTELVERIASARGVTPDRPARVERDAANGVVARVTSAGGKCRFSVTLTETCFMRILQGGTDPLLGARVLRTLFEREVETAVAEPLSLAECDVETLDIIVQFESDAFRAFAA